MFNVAVFVGSLSEKSINQELAHALQKLAASRLNLYFADISELPLYNEDLWATPPEAVLRLKQQIAEADAVLFVTPEYNRSVPGLLKNAIDWGSRPWGQNSWAGKPASIVGTSVGAIGSAVAQSHLRSILPFLDTVVMGQPEVYIAHRPGLIDASYEVTDPQTRAFLEEYVTRFVAFIERQLEPLAAQIAAE